MSKLFLGALCVLACASAALAGTSNPISISLDATLTLQPMNATGGNLYAYTVSSSRIASLYEYRFRAQLAPGSFVDSQLVSVTAYWKMPDSSAALTWQAMTPSSYYTLSSDGVAANGQFNVVVDPKQLRAGYQSYQVAPQSIQIGFLVSTASTNPLVANGLFSATLTEVHCPQVQDGDVPVGTAGSEITGSCSGTYSRCMIVANMQYHDHRYLLASARVTGGVFYSVRMHNAAVFSFNDVSYFPTGAGSQGPITVRTCLSNSSCAIEQDYYYIEMRTGASQTTDSSYAVTLSQQAAAYATAAASLVTAAAAAAVAFVAARSH